MYKEEETDSLVSLYSETQILLIELIQKYNFKIFYFKTSPKTKDKIYLNADGSLNRYHKEVKSIKHNQQTDLLWLYNNHVFEVIYTIPQINKEKNYYFDFLMAVNPSFDINKIYKNNFNLINIEASFEVFESAITYNFIKTAFEQRSIFNHNLTSEIEQKESGYSIYNNTFKAENYIKFYKNGNDALYNREEYLTINSVFHLFKFNQNLYVKNEFQLLCMNIWSFDRVYYKELNKFGYNYWHEDIYKVDSFFMTNFAELVNAKSINLGDDSVQISSPSYTYCSLSDNYNYQDIIQGSLSLEFAKKGFIDINLLNEKAESSTVIFKEPY